MSNDSKVRKSIERMHYKLDLIASERRTARAAEQFALQISRHYEPIVFVRGFFQQVFRKEGKRERVTFELTPEYYDLLRSFLDDQAHRRRVHADELEKQLALEGAQ